MIEHPEEMHTNTYTGTVSTVKTDQLLKGELSCLGGNKKESVPCHRTSGQRISLAENTILHDYRIYVKS